MWVLLLLVSCWFHCTTHSLPYPAQQNSLLLFFFSTDCFNKVRSKGSYMVYLISQLTLRENWMWEISECLDWRRPFYNIFIANFVEFLSNSSSWWIDNDKFKVLNSFLIIFFFHFDFKVLVVLSITKVVIVINNCLKNGIYGWSLQKQREVAAPLFSIMGLFFVSQFLDTKWTGTWACASSWMGRQPGHLHRNGTRGSYRSVGSITGFFSKDRGNTVVVLCQFAPLPSEVCPKIGAGLLII